MIHLQKTLFLSLLLLCSGAAAYFAYSQAPQGGDIKTTTIVLPVEAAAPEPSLETLSFQERGQALGGIFHSPIDRPFERANKKPFGLEITPETSPVEGDRFNGIHVGVDFEIFEGEENTPIAIYAICEGTLRLKTFANGYGGVAVQSCQLEGKDISVIYGHLHLESIEAEQGEKLAAGDFIGFLGKGHSAQTDGVRKHLHLGIRSGLTSDIRGYIKDETETIDWYNVLEYLQ